VRLAADTTPGLVNLAVTGALVTYLKPLVPDAGVNDPEGFFVQADQAGPALFVAVAPGIVGGGLVPGDRVDFTVTAVGLINGIRTALSLSNVVRGSRGNPVTGLTQSIVGVDFAVAGSTDQYESELVSLSATVSTDFVLAGSGYATGTLTTTGTPTGSAVELRLPLGLQASQDLGPGCSLSLSGTPLWRFVARAQPSAFVSAELAGTTCPAPRLTAAIAETSTRVRAYFDRSINPSASSGPFTIAGLSVSAATVQGREVVLTTSPQAGGQAYVLTVSAAVTDTRGTPVDVSARTATFTGLSAGTCSPAVVISQFYPGGGSAGSTWARDYVELHNRTAAPVDLTGWTIQYAAAPGTSWSAVALGGTIPPGRFWLVEISYSSAGTLPITPDFVSSVITVSGTSGKFIVMPNNVRPTGSCPTGPFADFIGYGTANCFEGASAAPTSSTTTSLQRDFAGCIDTNQNGTDFTSQVPTPRNSASPASICTCP
jgi:hypothetical protein